ncbi:hypothetical protein FB451DRAFT_1443888 [Mycena latifolia]|nr:hypothetical protein FB451DRAFT_1443888 [Mycena latifolia]
MSRSPNITTKQHHQIQVVCVLHARHQHLPSHEKEGRFRGARILSTICSRKERRMPTVEHGTSDGRDVEPFLMDELLPPPEMTQKRHKRYISSVMHMGMKSLEVLVPGGPDRLKKDLELIESGIPALQDEAQEKHLLKFACDPWLWTPFITLERNKVFTLWDRWRGNQDCEPLMKAIRNPPQKRIRI